MRMTGHRECGELENFESVHTEEVKSENESEIALRRDLLYEEVIKQQEKDEERAKAASVAHKPRRVYRPKSTRVGLTKVKMEECLRCDACSCIYIDPQDYYKHMRNFHQKFNTVIPRSRRKVTQQITLLSTMNEMEIKPKQEKQVKKTVNADETTKDTRNIQEHIKNRWSKVILERLKLPEQPVKIKEEPPDDDYSYLLGNVEVKIKTEPMDV
ncbi:uncharacterized protein LOC106663651 isoform X2 [Cimex lectularius]|uniref:C2H2-type domain-containing protein n=1 Tax=Cimex lectularius TaxID=79782 RepID=A0A8I6RHR6_CIMLE|nr:uncharacterized protein LOC106663651 isoform X2 [Cimex lectularius]